MGLNTSPTPPRGRLAPSPTGRLHLGNAFAFLTAWLDIRSLGGSLVLRIEDIDPLRSRPVYAASIMQDLAWLGLDWDEGPELGGSFGPYMQSERLKNYEAFLENLEERGLVYPCYCTRKELRTLASAPHIGDEGAPYPGTCRRLNAQERQEMERHGRRASLRLDTDASQVFLGTGEAQIRFEDMVMGRQSFDMRANGGDFALRRSDGVFAYQLAVAADDADMGVSRVVRGEDLLLSTPRQVLLFQLMGKPPPSYAHIPLLHDAGGERLAKRHKSLELSALREAGVSAEAICGYLGFLASWLERPQKASAKELVKKFAFQPLAQKHFLLPKDITGELLKIK